MLHEMASWSDLAGARFVFLHFMVTSLYASTKTHNSVTNNLVFGITITYVTLKTEVYVWVWAIISV